MTTIALNRQAVLGRIERAARESGRCASEIALLAVSKTVAASHIEEARRAGQTAFGESYVQEAVGKITLLGSEGLDWHFIGPLQSNKTRAIAEHIEHRPFQHHAGGLSRARPDRGAVPAGGRAALIAQSSFSIFP